MTNAIENVQLLPDANSLKKAEWVARRDAVVSRAAAIISVSSDQDLEVSGKAQTEMTKSLKELERARMDITRQIDSVKKGFMDQEKELAAPILAELDRIKSLNTRYATEKMRAAEESRKREEAERMAAYEREQAAKNDVETKARALFGSSVIVAPQVQPPAPAQPVQPMAQAPRTSSNSFVETWKFEVMDVRVIPREFMSPDDAKIRSWLNSQKTMGADLAALVVPGVRLYKEAQVRAK
jgi:hypothetical protein